MTRDEYNYIEGSYNKLVYMENRSNQNTDFPLEGEIMYLIDLKCQESISLAKDCSCIDFNKTSLLLGHDIQIFLYFELPPYCYSIDLKQARLILFKIPTRFEEDASCCCNQYYINPLFDFFSIYDCMYSPARIDCSQQVLFEDAENCSNAEIDITNVVDAWLEQRIENKGLLLFGNKNTKYISYASEKYNIIRMRPILRLTYEEKSIHIHQSLSKIPCTVKVQN